MIKTGEWAIADLVKYLVAVQQTLTPVELERLRLTSAFPREKPEDEADVPPLKYRANELYEPVEILRKLKLPIIDWGSQTRWRAQSEEGEFY